MRTPCISLIVLLALCFTNPLVSACEHAMINSATPSEEEWHSIFAVPYDKARLRLASEHPDEDSDWLRFTDSQWSSEALAVQLDHANDTTSFSWSRIDQVDLQRGSASVGKGVAIGTIGGAILGMGIGVAIVASDQSDSIGMPFLFPMLITIPIGAVTGGVVASHTPNWVTVFCGSE